MTFKRHGSLAVRTRQSERGIALPMVLLALVVLSVVAVTSMQIAGQQKQAGGGSLQTTKSFYAAEAGLHEVIASWDTARYDTLTALSGAGASIDLGKHLLPENGQVYRAMIHHLGDSTSKLYRITSEEMTSGTGRMVGVTVGLVENLNFVLFTTLSEMEVSGGSVTGDIGTNSSIGLTAPVTGNARAVGMVTDHSLVSGVVTEGADPIGVAEVACPAGAFANPDSTLPIDADPVFGPATEYGPAPVGGQLLFDPASGDVTITANSPTSFPGGTYYFHNLTVTGSSPITIPAGETVEIYVSNDLSIQAAGFDNQNNASENFKIIGCGGAPNEWSVDVSGGVSYLQIHAPIDALGLTVGGYLFGSFVAGKIQKTGPGIVFYDGPAEESSLTGFRPISGTWVDLTGAPSVTAAPVDTGGGGGGGGGGDDDD